MSHGNISQLHPLAKGGCDANIRHLVQLHRAHQGGGGPERFEKLKEIVTEEKGNLLHVYGLLGAYDALAVAEFPDNRAAMKAVAKGGNLIGAKTNTMAAVERDDFLKLLTEL